MLSVPLHTSNTAHAEHTMGSNQGSSWGRKRHDHFKSEGVGWCRGKVVSREIEQTLLAVAASYDWPAPRPKATVLQFTRRLEATTEPAPSALRVQFGALFTSVAKLLRQHHDWSTTPPESTPNTLRHTIDRPIQTDQLRDKLSSQGGGM